MVRSFLEPIVLINYFVLLFWKQVNPSVSIKLLTAMVLTALWRAAKKNGPVRIWMLIEGFMMYGLSKRLSSGNFYTWLHIPDNKEKSND